MRKKQTCKPWILTASVVMLGCPLYISLQLNTYIVSYFLGTHPAESVDGTKLLSTNFKDQNRHEFLIIKLNKHGHNFFPLSYSTSQIDLQVINGSDTSKGNISWHNSYPDINIAGNPKTGTSHLYRLLLGHSRIEAAQDKKEFCVRDFIPVVANDLCNSDSVSSEVEMTERNALLRFRDLLSRRRSFLNESQLTLNGCLLGSVEVELNFRFNPPRNEKFIILFRDPADWVWALFNYWAISEWDTHFVPGMLTDSSIHYRSPEIFHEIIASNGDLSVFHAVMEPVRRATYDSLRMINLVGRENILFLKNEDLHPTRITSTNTLNRLSEFLSIDINQFGNEKNEMTNCNNEKGTNIICTRVNPLGAYETSQGMLLLPKTRELIYSFCQNACTIWKEKLLIDYPNCYRTI